jgi:putative thioredoxin
MSEPLIGGGAAAADLIKESDTLRFEEDVIRASREVPVIVDFWAPWCGPCKQLGPALEREVKAAAGQVRLVKINIDENVELAQHLRIQSIPTVFGFRNGRLADGFVGVIPESQIRQFIQRLVGPGRGESPVAQALAEAKAAFEAGDYASAGNLYNQVYIHQPTNLEAVAGLIRCFVNMGEAKKAREVLDRIPADQRDHPDLASARAALELAVEGRNKGDLEQFARKLAANPADHQARFSPSCAVTARGTTMAPASNFSSFSRRWVTITR